MGESRMNGSLFKTWLRLFSYQGSWTFERLQGVGMAYCIEPLLKRLPGGPDGERCRAGMTRAVGYFNTHPFFAGLAVGAIARAEHDQLPPARIDRLRGALKGPLGSIGDRLVWSGVMPMAIGAGLLAGLAFAPLVGVAVFLVTFNTVHIGIRIWALRSGWRLGADVAQAMHRPWLQWSADGVRPLALLVLGFSLPFLARLMLGGFDPSARIAAVVVAIVTFAVSTWLAPTLGAARIGLLAVVAAVVVGII